jgi:hypothetical protein
MIDINSLFYLVSNEKSKGFFFFRAHRKHLKSWQLKFSPVTFKNNLPDR